MGRLCERPGCSESAVMSYGFDADRLLVWIAARDPQAAPLGAGGLCLRHGDAMVVPRGWTLDDRREAAPRLFRPAAPPPRAASGAAARSTRRPARVEPTLPLGCAGDADASESTVAELAGAHRALDPDATVAIPWLPDFDEHDDLGGVLAATTPLLARAFRGPDRPT